MTWRSCEGCLGEEVVTGGSWMMVLVGCFAVLRCAGSAMGLSSVEPSWSDAGGAS